MESPSMNTAKFVQAMDAGLKYTLNENGSTAYTASGVGNQLVAFDEKLVRDLNTDKIEEFIDNIIKQSKTLNKNDGMNMIVDLCVLMVHVRNIKDGKGERELFYKFFMKMYNYFPRTMISVLEVVGDKYGSWLDLREILNHSEENYYKMSGEMKTLLQESIYRIYIKQIYKDLMSSNKSLLGKWLPKEGGKYGKWANRLAQRLFPLSFSEDTYEYQWIDEVWFTNWLNMKPPVPSCDKEIKQRSMTPMYNKVPHSKPYYLYKRDALEAYRHLRSYLNREIKTVEIDMCRGTWSNIKPSSVPAKNLKIHRDAFMNKIKKGLQKGDTRSYEEDRVKCAINFNNHIELCKTNPDIAKVHGSNLQMYELVKIYAAVKCTEEDPILEAQFNDIVNRMRENGTMKKMIPIADVSSSMSCNNGIPLLNSIGLSALMSRVNHPAFRGRYMSFSENPRWHNIPQDWSLFKIVKYMMNDSSWGGNTNFGATINLIIDTLKEHNVPPSEVDDLILVCFSDMQFDNAAGLTNNVYDRYFNKSHYDSSSNQWEPHWKKIKASLNYVGYNMNILFWNLNANTHSHTSPYDAEGVMQMSGFSQNLLKLFMNGDFAEMAECSRPTPYDTLKAQLDQDCYNTIRSIISYYGEGLFKDYKYDGEYQERDEVYYEKLSYELKNYYHNVFQYIIHMEIKEQSRGQAHSKTLQFIQDFINKNYSKYKDLYKFKTKYHCIIQLLQEHKIDFDSDYEHNINLFNHKQVEQVEQDVSNTYESDEDIVFVDKNDIE